MVVMVVFSASVDTHCHFILCSRLSIHILLSLQRQMMVTPTLFHPHFIFSVTGSSHTAQLTVHFWSIFLVLGWQCALPWLSCFQFSVSLNLTRVFWDSFMYLYDGFSSFLLPFPSVCCWNPSAYVLSFCVACTYQL